MTIRPVILTGLVIALACFRSEASALVLDLVLEPPVHGYSPEWTFQSPSTGATFTMAAQSEDLSICSDAEGIVINLDSVTSMEFNLIASSGTFLHIEPSGVNYVLSYAITLEGWSLEGLSSGASSSLLGVVGSPPPWFIDSIRDNLRGDVANTLLHGSSQASDASFGFAGMHIVFPVPAQLANGNVILKSAQIGLNSRDLYGAVDPGQAMSLMPVPETSSLLFTIFGGVFFLRRYRSPV